MGLVGAIAGAAIGGIIVAKFARHPLLGAVIIGLIAVVGYTMLPW